ncbi:MAG: histidine kinase [Leptospiraceae bacterium]|nr:histidine kinase [Leptospiraceae bacterium]
MQPHFLMNSLNTLVALITTSPKKAAKMIIALGTEIRNILEISDYKEVSLKTELGFCESFLEIMSLRMEEKYFIELENITGEEKIPPLLFHTILENAFSHAKGDYSNLKFHLRKEIDKTVIYTFSSTAKNPEHDSARVGIGTKYIQNCLEDMSPGKWSVTQGLKNGNWVVKIEIG